MIKSPLPDPRHDPEHLQLPIEAVKIFLDRAIEVMYNNDGISRRDWVWFMQTTIKMRRLADDYMDEHGFTVADFIAPIEEKPDVPSV